MGGLEGRIAFITGGAREGPADVRDPAAMQDVTERAIEAYGRIDVLVANAGISGASPIAAMSEQQWRTVIDVNLTGVSPRSGPSSRT